MDDSPKVNRPQFQVLRQLALRMSRIEADLFELLLERTREAIAHDLLTTLFHLEDMDAQPVTNVVLIILHGGEGIRGLLKAILAREHLQLIECAIGEGAVGVAERVLDELRFRAAGPRDPGTDGVRLAELVRTAFPAIPVVAVSVDEIEAGAPVNDSLSVARLSLTGALMEAAQYLLGARDGPAAGAAPGVTAG